jgi:hypothetical protein
MLKTYLIILLLSGLTLENSVAEEPQEFINNFVNSVESG